jgi:hypothetical protein
MKAAVKKMPFSQRAAGVVKADLPHASPKVILGPKPIKAEKSKAKKGPMSFR